MEFGEEVEGVMVRMEVCEMVVYWEDSEHERRVRLCWVPRGMECFLFACLAARAF